MDNSTFYNDLYPIIQKILDGKCMLFLGSGFSKDAKNTFNNSLPDGRELAKILDEDTNYDSEGDLEEAADYYLEQIGPKELSQKLRDIFTVKETSRGQEIICSNPWRRIYTTNYDNIVEFITTRNGKKYSAVTLSSNPEEYTNKQEIVVHLNGSIYNLTKETISNEFKLTSVSYLTTQFQNSSWEKLFQFDIKDSDYIVFIGFSLKYDLDIKKILWEDTETKKKCIFINKKDEDSRNIAKISRWGKAFPIGLDSFAEMIARTQKTTPSNETKIERPFHCFKIPSIKTTSITKVKDESIIGLLLYGKSDELLVQQSIEHREELPYYIKRNAIDSVTKFLMNGGKNILIHSDMGNGKTLFINGLSYILKKSGYNIYVYYRYNPTLYVEIERICTSEDPTNTIFIVENYNTNKKIIEAILTFRTKQRLIVSERTVTNDMSYDWLREIVRDDFNEIDINRLEDSEIQQLILILNKFGLWREFSTLRDDKKCEHLKLKCNSSLRLILLNIIKSTDIKNRISSDIQKIETDKDIYQALVLMLTSNILSWNISLDDISYALDNKIKGNSFFRRNEILKEYVDFSNSNILVKSSILSEVILTEIMDVQLVRETLVKAFKNFDNNWGTDPDFQKYMKSILSYANLQKIFNKEDGDDIFNANIVQLFEDIRHCSFCERNPHYWLQYAIAKLGEQQYDVAKMYFDNAYTFAKQKTSFDTYQIDNHYARYLLENTIYTNTNEDFFSSFKQAHSILTDKSHVKDTKYYPFKVARLYLPFHEKYNKKMDRKELTYFYGACNQIYKMIQTYKNAIPHYRTKLEVKQAEENILQIIQKQTP